MKVFSKKMRFGLAAVFLAMCFIVPLGVKLAPPAYAASMEFLNTFYASIGRAFVAVTAPSNGLIVQGRVGVGEPYPTAKFAVSQDVSSEGTVSNIASGTTVTGVGTQFTKDCKIGDYISIDGAAPVIITAIASDILMTTAAITALHSAKTYTIYAVGDGTMSNILSGTTIAGSGTRFTEILRPGDKIYLSGVTEVVITTVTSDILMTVTAIGNLNSGVTYIYQNRTVLRAQGNGLLQFDQLKLLTYKNDALSDDAAFVLPDATDGFGFVKSGVSCTFFTTTAAGAVVVTGGTAGVAASDSDNNLCVFDSGTTVSIRNRSGSAQVVKVTYWYK